MVTHRPFSWQKRRLQEQPVALCGGVLPKKLDQNAQPKRGTKEPSQQKEANTATNEAINRSRMADYT